MLIYRSGIQTASRLHRESVRYVKASSQASVAKKLADTLSEEEKDILRRGRNANPGTVPKHALISDYRLATGFEALVGYLYLQGNMTRLSELMDMAARIIQEAQAQDGHT
jgi:ribonuclease-3 family protein